VRIERSDDELEDPARLGRRAERHDPPPDAVGERGEPSRRDSHRAAQEVDDTKKTDDRKSTGQLADQEEASESKVDTGELEEDQDAVQNPIDKPGSPLQGLPSYAGFDNLDDEFEARIKSKEQTQAVNTEQNQSTAQEHQPEQPSPLGWDAPGVRDDARRPDTHQLELQDERRTHVLDGDATGGGHRHGTGMPGKTEFPADWDDEIIISNIMDVARKPDRVEIQPSNERWRAEGERDGVTVRVIIDPGGRIVTAHPLPGGEGVRANPRTGGRIGG
jgi:hypothetical protein